MSKPMYMFTLDVQPQVDNRAWLHIIAYSLADACMYAEAKGYEVELVTLRRPVDASLVQRTGGNHE